MAFLPFSYPEFSWLWLGGSSDPKQAINRLMRMLEHFMLYAKAIRQRVTCSPILSSIFSLFSLC